MEGREPDQLPRYRVIQLEWDTQRGFRNEPVEDFERLVTHHPNSNGRARLVDGVVVDGQRGRTLAVVGGEIQEIEVARDGRDFGLQPDQVLVKKDFMLEDSRLPTGPGSRALDVPSPVSGVIGTVNARSGLVDILDREGGDVIARIRHMAPIHVQTGDRVEYGQAVGVQSNQATGAIHVHMEVDSRYYQQYENYLGDMVGGRLAIDPERRAGGVERRPVIDDGTIRIGESSGVVGQVQAALNAGGFLGPDQQLLREDGVYRLPMQAAVLNFQRANGLPQTGDIDPATLEQIAPRMFPHEVNGQGRGALPGYLNLQGATQSESPLHRQAEDAMRRLETELGRGYDSDSARMAASAACLAAGNGLSRIDHIVLSCASGSVRQGENLFVVQGELGNPAHSRAHMKTDDAITRPVEQSLAQLQSLDEVRQQQEAQQPEQAARQQHRIG